jgi:predicted PurR-regulated permease PerM
VRFDRLMEQLIGVLALLILACGTLIVIAPFITTLLWGGILAYCTWHPFQRLTNVFGGHRTWATFLVVLLILFVLLGPVFYGGIAFSAHAPDYMVLLQKKFAMGAPPLPAWLTHMPFLGPRIEETWNEIASRNPEIMVKLRELAGPMFRVVLGMAISVIQGLGLLVLSVLFAAVFYVNGESAASNLHAIMRHIAGDRSEYFLNLIGATIKGVVYGILGTSLVQALLCTVSYLICGLPSATLLGLITFFLAIIPGGPLLIIIPAAAWLTQNGQTGLAIFLVIWAIVVAIGVDNVLKPLLIGKSSHVPFILVMLGVLGGAAAFGLLGVFVGPTLLAVAHAVLREWTKDVVEASETKQQAAISEVTVNEVR